jgi:hypothetical protein
MNKTASLSAILGAMAIASTSASATGFITLPATGVAVPGGTSAYVTANLTGDFGSLNSVPPTFSPNGGLNNTGAVPSNNPPIAGYAQVANAVRNIVVNTRVIGTVTDRVWRSGTSCVYGAKIHLNNVDYDPAIAGTQYFEINDFLRAGFRNQGPIAIAYNFVSRGFSASDEVLYRAGLTYTSVVHKPGDTAQPLTSIAPISTNWVDFTTDVNFLDPDGTSTSDSSWLFVNSKCTTAAPTAVSGALKFRQKGQEGQPDIETSLSGYAPAGANVTP